MKIYIPLMFVFFSVSAICRADAPKSVQKRKPLAISLGAMKEIKAPPGSATAGSIWIEADVTYTNSEKQPIWVHGYSKSSLFYRIETRPHPSTNEKVAKWTDYGVGFCGTGSMYLRINPGATFSFSVALPEKHRGKDVRVLLDCYTDSSGKNVLTAKSTAKRLIPAKKSS